MPKTPSCPVLFLGHMGGHEGGKALMVRGGGYQKDLGNPAHQT